MTTSDPVALSLTPHQVERLQDLALELPDLDARLQGLPMARLDQDDVDEVSKLRTIVATYASTVLEFVEPNAQLQTAVAEHPEFSDDLIGVMERFVKMTNESLDKAMGSAV